MEVFILDENKEFVFDDIFTISMIMDKIKIDEYIDILEEKLSKIEKKYQKNGVIPDELKKDFEDKRKTSMIMYIFAFIISNIYKCKNEIMCLVCSYHKIDNKNVSSIGFLKLFPMIKEMFMNGLFDIIMEQIESYKNNDSILKKTLS